MEECAPSVPFYRLIGHSGFGHYFGHVEDEASGNTQEIISLQGGLMCNDDAICGERMKLKLLVRD